MRYSKHEVSTINMLYSLKNVSYFNTTLHPHNGHLSTTVNGHFFLSSRWPVGERFDYKPKLVKPTNQNALISVVILLHEKLLQFDWLRAVIFQLNLKYLHVKITSPLQVVV